MNDLKNDVYEMSMLLDFYGSLLTESQYKAMDLYFNEDLSLAELAETMEISRQGAHDFIKRGRAQLSDYESKLKLLEKFLKVRDDLSDIQSELQLIDQDKFDRNDRFIMDKAQEKLSKVINSL